MSRHKLAIALSFLLVVILQHAHAVSAQATGRTEMPRHSRYRLVDLGTLGGPDSGVTFFSQTANLHHVAIGSSDTSIPNPSFGNPNPFFLTDGLPDPYVQHSFRWKNDNLRDLGALPGGYNSAPTWINTFDTVSGASETGLTDPLMGGVPATTPVIWRHGKVINLGTFGGFEGVSWAINDRDQAVGMATNTLSDQYPDPGLFIPFGAQVRAFVWERGTMHDMGTLGGPSAVAFQINEQGQAAGVSYTSLDPGPLGIPPVNPFFWDSQHGMKDLGSLGGVFSFESFINNRGWVVGASSLADDPVACANGVGVPNCHAFLWRPGHKKMRDLGTLGGTYSDGLWVDDSGGVVGSSTTQGDQELRPFLWKNGHMTNLGSLNGDPCSRAFSSNSKGQVVGVSLSDCNVTGHAFLWENGGPMVDLNSLIPPNPDFQLHEANFIGENGEITGKALLANGDAHAFLLIPLDCGHEAGLGAIESADEGTTNLLERTLTPEMRLALRHQRTQLRHIVGNHR
jgi:probable HAF family extracellular repeat protein